MQQNDNIMVSIWCITYNHARFIRDTLEGFVSQKTNFRYKIVLYDDASTDGTSDIVREYLQKYPDLFDAYISEKNTFKDPDRRKFMLEYRRKHFIGKYIAYCEGDDCWIDPYKLQKQVDYLESHFECSMCLHNALWIDYMDKRMYSHVLYDCADGGKILNAEEIIRPLYVHPPTASFLVRRDVFDCDDLFFMAPVGDYPLMLAALTKGYIYYDSRIMSVYRWMTSGSFNSIQKRDINLNTQFCLGLISFLIEYDKLTGYVFNIEVESKIYGFLLQLIENLGDNISIAKSVHLCTEYGYSIFGINNNIINKIEYYRKLIMDDKYLPKKVDDFLLIDKKTWIMGVGKFSKKLAEKFNNNNVKFEGFVVSNLNDNPIEFMGKPVISLSKLDSQEDKVIIGIIPNKKNEVKNCLIQNGITEYIFAFEISW